MPLRSLQFRGDTRLEACLVNDQAHLTIGTVGPFVRKVQQAVAMLTGRSASLEEVQASRYGQSTADAVLAYKRARSIVNKAYQATADNVVGKMTIKSLDDEMVRMEARPPELVCGDPVTGVAPRRSSPMLQGKTARGFSSTGVGFRLPDLLRITWQISTLGEKLNGRRLNVQVDACNKILPDDLLITTIGPDLNLVRAFEYNEIVPVVGEAHVAGLVRAAAKARTTSPSELRVIVHPLVDPQPTFGITKFGPYDGEHLGAAVVLNASLQRNDNLTLLHEMIHATGLLFHDSEPGGVFDQTSVFSTNEGRDHIRTDHIQRLHKQAWCIVFPDTF